MLTGSFRHKGRMWRLKDRRLRHDFCKHWRSCRRASNKRCTWSFTRNSACEKRQSQWASHWVARANITTEGRNDCANLWDNLRLIMELSGEEKKIRASFLELKLEDERVAPQFSAMSNRAHRSGARQQIAFDFRTAAAVVTICFALFLVALSSKRPRSDYLGTAA